LFGMEKAITTFGIAPFQKKMHFVVDAGIKSRDTANIVLKQAGLKKGF
jgi:hypothetical protein